VEDHHLSAIELKAVRKSFGAVDIIHGVDLSIEPGEFCVFVGPSGCGKSTLLRMIAGLEDTTDGEIRIEGKVVNDVEPGDRQLAMVFQSYALYPHMTVAGNMGFGLRMTGTPKPEVERRVNEAASILRLEQLMHRRPAQLSGGQRQRVAIGRAIVRQPKAFLFDEPLSNLDAELRVQMRIEIAKLHQELGATMIYVTHDQVEAMTLADKIVVLRSGRIEQIGRPVDLYRDPDNMFVAGFIGSPKMNFMEATALANGTLALGETVFRPTLRGRLTTGQKVVVGVRPEQFDKAGANAVELPLAVEVIENLGGASILYGTLLSGEKLLVEKRGIHEVRPGDSVKAGFAAGDALVFDAEGSRIR
jgi:lactose/L-arabinose transport system ATP-binding protein